METVIEVVRCTRCSKQFKTKVGHTFCSSCRRWIHEDEIWRDMGDDPHWDTPESDSGGW